MQLGETEQEILQKELDGMTAQDALAYRIEVHSDPKHPYMNPKAGVAHEIAKQTYQRAMQLLNPEEVEDLPKIQAEAQEKAEKAFEEYQKKELALMLDNPKKLVKHLRERLFRGNFDRKTQETFNDVAKVLEGLKPGTPQYYELAGEMVKLIEE